MDLSFSLDDEAFREEVRSFIAEAGPRLPEKLGPPEKASRSRDEYMTWHKLLYARGWVAPAWPKEYGGAGWSVTRRFIFQQEAAAADMPNTLPFGLGMVGAGDLYRSAMRRRNRNSCRAYCRARTGGARAIPNRARVQTSHH